MHKQQSNMADGSHRDSLNHHHQLSRALRDFAEIWQDGTIWFQGVSHLSGPEPEVEMSCQQPPFRFFPWHASAVDRGVSTNLLHGMVKVSLLSKWLNRNYSAAHCHCDAGAIGSLVEIRRQWPPPRILFWGTSWPQIACPHHLMRG